jgi:quinol monooxygenase YgiN
VILVTGSFRLPPEKVAEAQTAMERTILASRSETGCIVYSYAKDLTEPGLIRVAEAWTDREALSAHFDSPHMRQWQQERAGLGFYDRKITAYAVTEGDEL